MRLFANRTIRRLLRSLAATFTLFVLLSQWINGGFSWGLLLLSLAAAAAVMLLLLRYFRAQDETMDQAVRQMNRFLSGQRDARIHCDEEGELFCLFQTVNTLASVLNAQTDRQKQTNEFLKSTISDISHQLKTPLAALGIYNGLIAEAEDLEDVRRFAVSSEAELDRIDALVRSLLKLARMDAGAIVFEKRPEDMAEIMENLKERFACRAKLEGKEIRLMGDDVDFPCDAPWIAEAFGNILKNALDHTSENGIICVEWKRNGNIMNVTIRDNGSGIHPEDIGHIFKRFYRSRFSKDTQGIGLGLPLAKTIIEAHDGVIEVESAPGRGTAFLIHFLIPTEL